MSPLSSVAELALRSDSNSLLVPYFYIPSKVPSQIFIVLFSLLTTIILTQSLYYRKLWFLPTAVFGGIIEILGWSGRLWLASNPNVRRNAFEMTTTTSLVAPTLILAGNVVVLFCAIQKYGERYISTSLRWFKILFSIALVVGVCAQVTGDNIASGEEAKERLIRIGTRLALAGNAFVLGITFIFAAVLAEFAIQLFKVVLVDSKIRMALYSIAFGTFCHTIRLIYRVVEFANGWAGSVMRNQTAFVILDALMVILAMTALVAAIHGLFVPRRQENDGERMVPTTKDYELKTTDTESSTYTA